MKRGNPPDLPLLIKPAAPPHPASIALLVPFVYRSHNLVMQLPRTLRPVIRPRTNATNRQPTTKISTFDNIRLLFTRRIHFTLGLAFVPSPTLLAVSTPTAPRSFQGLLHQQESKQQSLNFRPFLKVDGHFGSPCATHYRLYPIRTLLLRSYRHLYHSPGLLISTSIFSFLHIIIPAQYLTHSPGARIRLSHSFHNSVPYDFSIYCKLVLFSRRFDGGTRTLHSLFAPLPI